jgi:hypothetical protein
MSWNKDVGYALQLGGIGLILIAIYLRLGDILEVLKQ